VQKILGSAASMVVGAVIAAVTIFGLVNSQVNSPSSNDVDVSQPSVDYGTTD
jgi:hypothetical protein